MIIITKTPLYPAARVARAIDLEAAAWAKFFKVTDSDAIEARRRMMRANIEIFDYYDPLIEFMAEAVAR